MLESAIEKIYASELVRGELTIIWHAGEPLAVPISVLPSLHENALDIVLADIERALKFPAIAVPDSRGQAGDSDRAKSRPPELFKSYSDRPGVHLTGEIAGDHLRNRLPGAGLVVTK